MYNYDWLTVKSAADRLFNILGNRNITDATNSVYNDNLPLIIERIFVLAYLNNFDRNNPDIQILISAYK